MTYAQPSPLVYSISLWLINPRSDRMLLEFPWTQNIPVLEDGRLARAEQYRLGGPPPCLSPLWPWKRAWWRGTSSATFLSSSSCHKTDGASPPLVRLEKWTKYVMPFAPQKLCWDGELQKLKVGKSKWYLTFFRWLSVLSLSYVCSLLPHKTHFFHLQKQSKKEEL